jgi:ribonucleoside-diphosphate reductase alpha chain
MTELKEKIRQFDLSKVPVRKTNLEWTKLIELLKVNCRNSQLFAIAPNTSSSLLMGSSASFLPVFKRFFIDSANKGVVPITPTYIQDKFWFYQENPELDQIHVIDMVGESIQPWTDTGISMELICNLNKINAKGFYDLLIRAWQKKCKTVYYIRSQQLETKDSDGCTVCAN